ncbi:MAG TPA: PASTA domain-containing protein [Pyrinomonadaceae bacterium]
MLGLILCAFAFGLAGTVYLSLRSPSVEVPDVTNKTFNEGESALETTGLSIRERARRYKSDVRPGVILDQFPRAGAVVKQGQTVAVIVARAPKEGEAPSSDEIVEGEEKKAEAETAAAVANENQNRPRRKTNTNKNTNANVNANNRNSNASTGGSNANAGGTQNANRTTAPNANRNANSARNGNTNDRPGRNTNNRSASTTGARNANSTRNANGNKRPN